MAAPKGQFPAMYEEAIRNYREITNELLDVGSLSKIRNVEDLSKEIDETSKTFNEFHEKRGAIFDALESAMTPVQLFGDLAAGFNSMVFPPSCLVFGAVAHLMGAEREVSAAYDAIQGLMQMLQV
ncbi:hypothetical protein N7475_005798 [Penicillium sp. IBT 31633x]|nr:hypothetical protein N7475_005798 [Penicillium sp. IBT 31633x]